MSGAELTIRQIRSLTVLAEELNFTRAAQRLFVSQQSLSGTIRQIEMHLGVRLFARTTRQVELTEAGIALVAEMSVALDAIERGVRHAQQIHEGGQATLRVGILQWSALDLAGLILKEFRAEYPLVKLELHEYRYEDPAAGLGDDRTDVAFVRLPISGTEIATEVLFTEPRVVAVAASHPLAKRSDVRLDEVLSLPMVGVRSVDPVWNDFWLLTEARRGRRPIFNGSASSTFEELDVVASGLACTNIPAGWARLSPHPGVAYLTVPDLTPSVSCIAWRQNAFTPTVAAFVDCARRVRHREAALIEEIERGR